MNGIVLSNNLISMYMSWELVGVSSYLLIGHWFEKDSAANAAKKAFLTNRVGDIGFFIGIMLIYTAIGSFVFGDIFEGVSQLSKNLKIDVIVLSPQSVEIKDEVYLGKVTTKIIRQTNIPLLIVPPNYLFRKLDTILFAF